MEMKDIRKLVEESTEYQFLRTHPLLNDKNENSTIILLGMGGSHSYGTNRPDSDVDIRGVAVNSPDFILTGNDFEQVVDVPTDTTIYSLDKILKLFCACNPNTIEMLGLKPEHYLTITPIGQMLLDNKDLFLSQLAIYTFGGYANAQLRRMENKSARVGTQVTQENNILKSIEHAWIDLKRRHFDFDDGDIKLYLDTAVNSELEQEIFMDIVLKHYPLRDYTGLHSELMNIVKDYKKNNHRNTNAITHDKLGKHMMHLVRLYLMCFDILERGEINTYRENDLPLLMSIRDGVYLDENRQPSEGFYALLEELDKRFDYAKKHTILPEKVDMNKVRELHSEINRMVVEGRV